MRSLDERGLTLTELALVGVMGFLVMSAIMAFYMNCQGVWTDASSKSITQRELTGLSEHIAEQVHLSARAVVTEADQGGPTLCRLDLYSKPSDTDPWYSFWWQHSDSLVHEGPPGIDRANITSIVERFQFVECGRCDSLVELTELQLRSAEGRRVSLGTTMALYNR